MRLVASNDCLRACWVGVQQVKVGSILYARLVQVKAP